MIQHSETHRNSPTKTEIMWYSLLIDLFGFLVCHGDLKADWEAFPPSQEQKCCKRKLWMCGFLPSIDCRRGFGQVQCWILRYLDGLLHASQQTLASLSPQGGAETLWTPDQQLHHHVGIFLHTLTWYANTARLKLSHTLGDDLNNPQKERKSWKWYLVLC